MNKHYKIFIFIAIVITTIFSIKVYNENKTIQNIKNLSIKYEAKAISNFLISFRTVYQKIFINGHTELDKTNINFLPVRTTNDIAKIFAKSNMQTKITTVSKRPRNAINMANQRQLKVIEEFENNKNKKSLFKVIDDKYYYSEPLYIDKYCLKCHGKKEDAPKIIRDNYDMAYDYKIGELRGIIDIEVTQNELGILLDKNNNKRIYFALVVIFIILIIFFLYVFYNMKLEDKVSREVIKNKEKDKQLLSIQKEQKEYLNTVIESSNNAIIAIDKTKTILTYNKKAQDIFGFTKEEMIGSQNLLNIIPLKYKNLHTVASSLYFKTGKSNGILDSTLELEGLTKKRNIIPIRITFGTNNNKDKTIVVATISDLSQEKKQEKLFQQQSRLAQMGEMISMIAHQWRQPLTAISATSASLTLKARLDNLNNDTVVELSKKISNYSQHLSSTIDDFRDFFKSNKEKKETTFNELTKSVLSIVEVSIINKNIKLTQELSCEDKFLTYPNEIKQVILNLIKNAEDALLEKEIQNPYIKIKSFKENNKLILEISDNAGGIPKDIIENIFDPYFSTKTQKDGTGLGLYMSKTIIEEHCGGELRVYNDEFGAVFEMKLPATKD